MPHKLRLNVDFIRSKATALGAGGMQTIEAALKEITSTINNALATLHEKSDLNIQHLESEGDNIAIQLESDEPNILAHASLWASYLALTECTVGGQFRYTLFFLELDGNYSPRIYYINNIFKSTPGRDYHIAIDQAVFSRITDEGLKRWLCLAPQQPITVPVEGEPVTSLKFRLCCRLGEQVPLIPDRTSEQWLYEIDRYTTEYIPLINKPGDGNCIIAELTMADLNMTCQNDRYSLPEVFRLTEIPLNCRNDPSCRLASYSLTSKGGLAVRLSETSYGDYLKSGEHLDDATPTDPNKTFREAFGRLVRDGATNLRPFNLTNICGAGVFIISRGFILISQHSVLSHVYPGRLTFSASGAMKWGAYPNPFTEVMRTCFAEVGHQINPQKLRLIGFGVDARKLFFQFSFFEQSDEDIEKLKLRAVAARKNSDAPTRCEAVPFDDGGEIIDWLFKDDSWEPAAEAALLSLCLKEFGRDWAIEQLQRRKPKWGRRQMKEEWDFRSRRPGWLPDMTPRYAANVREAESRRYIECIVAFMEPDLEGHRVIEVGAGSGRLTERLVDKASSVTCVEFCHRMVELNKERLRDRAGRVTYVEKFFQDFSPDQTYHVVICSLVLIHNTEEAEFVLLVKKMCNLAKTIFVFEDVTQGRQTGRHTRIRSVNELQAAFADNQFYNCRQAEHLLCTDTIVCLKFVHGRGPS